ncbi:CpaF family protein [Nocardioides humilatus]|uniref:CpaF family protein n=1 Tax=Nocardioides humilatus TaxID=2607660 RepID=UPI001FE46714|nr:ATPase, T2SS/T4P/T4SS family [Nocardioides humilatus]
MTVVDDVVARLDEELRVAVRRDGLDPQREVAAVRGLAEAVVREHDDRSLTGVVAPVGDADAMVAELVARVAGFGPLQPLLDDPTVEEVWINSPDRVFVARHGRHELTNLVLTEAQVSELVERMLKTTGRRIDMSRPFVDAMLPQGHRLHVVLQGISRGFSAVNIRKYVVRAARLSELVALQSLTPSAAQFLEASVRAGLNILVSGATQAGKTTMLNCLAAAIPGGERVISVEEVFEMRFPHPDWVAMQTRQEGLEGTGEVRLRDLVKESLRMRPSRIIVGEVRAEEALDLLLALNSGLPGLCTIHANSARDALTKVCTLPLLAGENISARFVVPTVASSVDLVVHLELDPRGVRRVVEIVAVPGRAEQDIIETEPVFEMRDGVLRRGIGMPPRIAHFERVGIDVRRLLHEAD